LETVSKPLGDFDPKATYDAAALDYDDASRDYWQFLSVETVDRLGLRSGDRVLDAACGTGPALIPAAKAVGPSGSVVGVDYAGQMLAIARDRVARASVTNVKLVAGDMTSLDYAEESFDAVLSVLGIFFADDMPGTLRSFWSLLRSGGRLGITVLGHDFFSPMRDVFVEAVGKVRPELQVVQPWLRTEDPHTLRRVFRDAGLEAVTIASEVHRLPLRTPNDWWRIVLGTGLRRTVTQLDSEAAARVRDACLAFIQENHVTELILAAHYATAEKR
jgi:ubiquinone/menaquinone biosynthesis C-methylase UbiE